MILQCEDNIWMTRKQIGEALEYSNPQKAIDNLHNGHKDRLDKHSVTLKLGATDNKKYDTTLYNERGVMEICRWSRQPKSKCFQWIGCGILCKPVVMEITSRHTCNYSRAVSYRTDRTHEADGKKQ